MIITFSVGVGKYLCHASLGELPQIFGITIGDMAINGLRPAIWNQDNLITGRDGNGAKEVLMEMVKQEVTK